MADDIDQGYTWETEYERTWYVHHYCLLPPTLYDIIIAT